MTFDVLAQVFRGTQYNWQTWYEVCSLCRACNTFSIFLVKLKDIHQKEEFELANALVNYRDALNKAFDVDRFMSVRDEWREPPPAHLPENIELAFTEGAACLSTGCVNAAAAMFRLSIDLATKPLLPDPADAVRLQPNARQRRDLGLRLPWLFDNGLLPEGLRPLAACVREDGNDGAHAGTLSKEDADDLLDFTKAILERLITEPKKLEIAEARRAERRRP